MEKHGGQICEGPREILVCIVDDHYGVPEGLGEEEEYDWFKNQLEADFSQSFDEVDVAPGYSLPAFATFIQNVSEYWPFVIATFFLAKPVSENTEVWLKAAKGIKHYFSRSDVVLGRNAAAALAVEAICEDLDGIPRTIECHHYQWRDRRFAELSTGSDDEAIQDGPRTEYLSMAIHKFKIRADGVEFEADVEGKSVQLRRN
ncbi:MAG: hypothetical protein ABJF50_07305 [Paracoccaceae bacterium]|uniref:hypothetical protein n=1 Tax=Yoonia sp. TaxID=2212373 RepID=UPI00328534BA